MAKIETQYVLVGRDRTKRAFGSFRRSTNAARNAVIGLTAVFGAIGFGRIARDAIVTADAFNKVSDRLGISTEAFSELAFAAEQTGVKTKQLELGIQRLQRRVAEAAKGTGEAQSALRELGVDAVRLSQLPLDQQFAVIADRLNLVESESDKVRLAFKLFDSEGVALLQTLKGGSAALQNYRDRARQLGITLSQDAADAASEAKDRVNEFQTALDALVRTLAVDVLPTVNSFIEAINRVFVPLSKEAELIRQLNALYAARADAQSSGVLEGNLAQIEQKILDTQRALADLRNEAAAAGVLPGGGPGGPLGASGGDDPITSTLTRINAEAGTVENRFARLADSILPSTASGSVAAASAVLSLQSSTERAAEAGRELGFTFSSAFENAVVEGEKLSDVLKGLLKDLARIILRSATQPFFEGLFGGLIPGRASGGPVSRNKPYVVGERGPELFVPGSSGNIVPNRGMGGVTIQNVVNVDARADREQIRAELLPVLSQTSDATVQRIRQLSRNGELL